MKSVGIMVAALVCGLASQGLVRPRALEARRCWPPDSSQNLGWKHAAPIVGRELVADILWAKVLVYYGDARLRQSGSRMEEQPLACGPRRGRLKAAAKLARGEQVDRAVLTARNADPRCAPCGLDWDRPDFRYLAPLLDALLAVDPGFKRVYRWAAFAVTYKEERPTQEEFLLSLDYLHRAIARHPDDPEYLWLAGTRYFLDLDQDPATQEHCRADLDALPFLRPGVSRDSEQVCRDIGVALIESAMRKPGAPRSYTELAAAFNTKLGRQQRALRNLQETILTVESPEARARLIEMLRLYQADDLADELDRVTRDLHERWRATLPFAPPSLYYILGDRPPKVIDFDALATERDLFGSEPP